MKKMRKKKKPGLVAWMRSRPLTLLAFGLAVVALTLIVQLPRRAASLERQEAQLTQAMATYGEKQAEYNVLQTEVARLNDPEYIEMLARRDHGYGWYGETIYEIGNLEEIQAAQQEAVAGGN